MINLTNNIPVKFDLFIYFYYKIGNVEIEDFIHNNSKASQIKISVLHNKENTFPNFFKLKRVIKKYKYICQINTNKLLHNDYSDKWGNYLYNNLLGNNEIISEILSDFENYESLGLIFPDPDYKNLDLRGKNEFNSYSK